MSKLRSNGWGVGEGNSATPPRGSVLDRRKQISVRGISSLTNVAQIKQDFNRHLHYTAMKDRNVASNRDYYFALAQVVKDYLVEHWLRTQQGYYQKDPKRIYFLSMEYCMGRMLSNTMINLGIQNECDEALYQLGLNIEELEEIEQDAALGDGGMGRLAACMLDSMATQGLCCYGFGIRYEYGIFEQLIKDGNQIEYPDDWLRFGNCWECCRKSMSMPVNYYGEVVLKDGRSSWINTEVILGVPYDVPIAGYMNKRCNTLRLWAAKAPLNFNLKFFNSGQYIQAVMDRQRSEDLSRVMYPSDYFSECRELRLKQEYFLAATSLQDMIRRYQLSEFGNTSPSRCDFALFTSKVGIHLNATHLSIAIPELMRILLDEYSQDWKDAWKIVTSVFSYTNHHSSSLGIEKWPVDLVNNLLPRHLQIIYEINAKHLEEVDKRYPNNREKKRVLSLIEETPVKCVNMVHLCLVACHSINGVSNIHTDILKHEAYPDFYEYFPQKFKIITNGISPRRWLLTCNPELANLIAKKLNSGDVFANLSQLSGLKNYENENHFIIDLMKTKENNKIKLALYLKTNLNIYLQPGTMFDVQLKRLNQYKRQLLKCLHIVYMYNMIRNANQENVFIPRTVIFAGKAPPGSPDSKNILKLILRLSDTINNDVRLQGSLKVIFVPNYKVSLAEKIIPAADLSEQISLPGTEACGTSNMKFMLNGALTIGSLDGSNIDIMNEVGAENIFTFGMSVENVRALKQNKSIYEGVPSLRNAIDLIASDHFNKDEPGLFYDLVNDLLNYDRYCVLADFESYVIAQERADKLYEDRMGWTKKCLINIASAGRFSSDRAVLEYAKNVWNIETLH